MKPSLECSCRRRYLRFARTGPTVRAFVMMGSLAMLGSLALACNVPVYRYALDHWLPAPYRAVLLHRGALSEIQQQELDVLRSKISLGQVNLDLRTLDLNADAQPEEQSWLQDFRDEPHDAHLWPRWALQYPVDSEIDAVIWSGPTATMIDSPLRQSILQQLTHGDTAVWVMIEGGDSALDDAASELLRGELANLERSLVLPTQTDAPEDELHGGPALRVAFSVKRVARDDPQEQALLAMLLHCEDDLQGAQEPIAFPIFGRNRVLLPLVGDGISPDNIRSSSAFLVGACSCQVKERNPGFDLLVSADWKTLIDWKPSSTGTSSIEFATKNLSSRPIDMPASSQGKVDSAAREPTLLTIPTGIVETMPLSGSEAGLPVQDVTRLGAEPDNNRLPGWFWPAFLLGLLLLGIGGFFVVVRRSSKRA